MANLIPLGNVIYAQLDKLFLSDIFEKNYKNFLFLNSPSLTYHKNSPLKSKMHFNMKCIVQIEMAGNCFFPNEYHL